METRKATEIISLLSDGVNPYTGEVFPEDSPYQHPDTVRALLLAMKGLERIEKYEKRQGALPANAGKAWNEEEEGLLAEAYDKGQSIIELTEAHGRTKASIKARLVKLGKIEA
ncbi:hypothetical protein [Salimicrobium flavidum]|uniref:Homeodomain-like domain-containing protein n=1 Tax=Salimicrobium flavidum TaxID=570947 RepID=A0A1N7JJL7_9BACI|nr:hypothetical protein [Salimicrobium flavidum]SIS49562.1 hypothetical protein SAMN05421687_106163 [Salimicrobium flavidum]